MTPDHSEPTLDLAVVGCGAIAHWHLDAIQRAGLPIRVTAAVDPDAGNAAKIADRTGSRPFGSLTDALAAGVDSQRPHKPCP